MQLEDKEEQLVQQAQAKVRADLRLSDFMVDTRLVFTKRGNISLEAQERKEKHKVHKRILAGIPTRDAEGNEMPEGRIFWRNFRHRYEGDEVFRADCEQRGRGPDWMDSYGAELRGDYTPQYRIDANAKTALERQIFQGQTAQLREIARANFTRQYPGFVPQDRRIASLKLERRWDTRGIAETRNNRTPSGVGRPVPYCERTRAEPSSSSSSQPSRWSAAAMAAWQSGWTGADATDPENVSVQASGGYTLPVPDWVIRLIVLLIAVALVLYIVTAVNHLVYIWRNRCRVAMSKPAPE